MQAVPSRVGAEVAALKPDACKDSTCAYPKNMRAAQCVLGPEILNSPTKGSRLSVPFRPEIPVLDEKVGFFSAPETGLNIRYASNYLSKNMFDGIRI